MSREGIASLGDNVMLAVDDAGASFASLRHILELRPPIVKLDRELVRDIDSDPARQARSADMANFAARSQITLVAEGVESREGRRTRIGLGVWAGRGYLSRSAATDDAAHRRSAGRLASATWQATCQPRVIPAARPRVVQTSITRGTHMSRILIIFALMGLLAACSAQGGGESTDTSAEPAPSAASASAGASDAASGGSAGTASAACTEAFAALAGQDVTSISDMADLEEVEATIQDCESIADWSAGAAEVIGEEVNPATTQMLLEMRCELPSLSDTAVCEEVAAS